MDSILDTIKKMLGIESTDTAFDVDVIVNINSVFMILNQLGIGPINSFSISGKDETWDQFLSDNTKLEAVKTYMYLKVRALFDPPTISAVLDSLNRQITELEWRLNVQAEGGTISA